MKCKKLAKCFVVTTLITSLTGCSMRVNTIKSESDVDAGDIYSTSWIYDNFNEKVLSGEEVLHGIEKLQEKGCAVLIEEDSCNEYEHKKVLSVEGSNGEKTEYNCVNYGWLLCEDRIEVDSASYTNCSLYISEDSISRNERKKNSEYIGTSEYIDNSDEYCSEVVRNESDGIIYAVGFTRVR